MKKGKNKFIWTLLCIGVLLLLQALGNQMRSWEALHGPSMVREHLQALDPDMAFYTQIDEGLFAIYDSGNNHLGYASIGGEVGFGGMITLGTVVTPAGYISNVVVLSHGETASFFEMVIPYEVQFIGMHASSAFAEGSEIYIVTGATVTSRAVTDIVRNTSHHLSEQVLGATVAMAAGPGIQIGFQEIAGLVIFGVAIAFAQIKKLQKHQQKFWIVSTVVIGFWLNRMLSVAQLSALFLGFFPPVVNLLFYIVILGVLIPIILFGKNTFCTFVCPFGGLMVLLNKISRKNIPLKTWRVWFVRLRLALLFITLAIISYTSNMAAVAFEPFGLAFRPVAIEFDGFNVAVQGAAYLWAILAVTTIAGLFFRRIWCIGLCPVGATLDTIRDMRNYLQQRYFPKKKKPAVAKAPVAPKPTA